MLQKISYFFGLVLTVILISGCNDEKILDNLTQEQANQVLSVLQQHNISAHKNGNLKAGYAVTVDSVENTAALSIINQYQLPWAADVQIAHAFPDSSLVSSPGAEQARIRSLQEQRLEQSLRIIDQVVNARVHISYPYYANDISGKKSASHIGILISYSGEVDNNIFISQIKNLIKNSIDDIRYENISVVLFNAPVIQYASPLKVTRSISGFWIILLSSFGFIIVIISSYFIYNQKVKFLHKKDHIEKQDNKIKSETNIEQVNSL
ncbi:type III secretion system inner membrane ring lipoprotein SctJ [Klebsiella sp. BIGb0407]|uniref:type III secretion system inner membrane ring lipoprotein SctJ n=1 Tax=Klebsiella sp. BIGb0407 TaxID=2940603 RepID=UPI00216888AC|nr:type III secretion inner membrane ring lipoprotein SctJ [Klebsiella sp. BIGb0407]